jgi:hypothetical protein
VIKPIESAPKDDFKEIDELPPLHRAGARGKLLDLIALLDEGEDINTALPFQAVRTNGVCVIFYFGGCTPLHLASWFGKGKAINLLLGCGANIVAPDMTRSEALVYAICGEDPRSCLLGNRR